MVHKSKLKLALAAEKGLDYRKIKEKRKVKANLKEKEKKKAEKAKRYRGDDSELQEDDEEWQDDEGSDEDEVENALFDMEAEESDDDEGDDDKEVRFRPGKFAKHINKHVGLTQPLFRRSTWVTWRTAKPTPSPR